MLIQYKNKCIDLSKPIDLSIPLGCTDSGAKAWYVDSPIFSPVETDTFIGDTRQGSSVNFYEMKIIPHGHGTHTECIGHITQDRIFIKDVLNQFHWDALLITVDFTEKGMDRIITLENIKKQLEGVEIEKALIIRTLPNTTEKLNKEYSNTNFPYFEAQALAWLRTQGVIHLLIDLPSVDKENDNGKLLAHKSFWDFDVSIKSKNTITEMIYVPNEVEDGKYLLNLQVLNLALDASPSRPVIYEFYKC